MSEAYNNSVSDTIPEDWKIKRIGEFAEVTAGGTPSTKVPKYWGGDIPWMNSGEINLRRVKSVEGRITEEGLKNSSAKLIPASSVLMALAGQGKTRGKVAVNEIEVCTNQSLAAIINPLGVNPEFLFQNLESRYKEIRSLSTGDGGRGGLNLTIIKSIEVAHPPLPEQQKISEILSTVDEKIEVIGEQISQTQELKRGLMQRLLTKGIGHTQFKESPLGKIPESWKVMNLGENAKLIGGYAFKSSDSCDFGTRWLKISNVTIGRIIWEEKSYLPPEFKKEYKDYVLKENDIVIAMTRPILGKDLKIAKIKKADEGCLLNQRVGRVDFTDQIIREFAYQVFNSPSFISSMEKELLGTDPPNISGKMFESLPMALPPLPEQQKIAEILSTVDEKLGILKNKKQQYQELKKGLMQQLLTGKIRVTNFLTNAVPA